MSDETNLDSVVDAPPARRGGGPFALAANALAAIGTVWIFLMMLVIVADVAGRNLFDAPITGVAEVCARSVVAIVFLQIASAVLAGRMTRADFLIRPVSRRFPGLTRVVEALFALAGVAVYVAILLAAWPDTAEAWRSGEYFGVQGVFTIPTLPFRAIIVIGAGFAALAYLIAAAASLLRDRTLPA